MNIIQGIKAPIGALLFRCYGRFVGGLQFRLASAADMDALFRFRFEVYTGEAYVDTEHYFDLTLG